MSMEELTADDLERPIKRVDGATLEDRMTANAYHNILPARYLRKDDHGDLVETQEELFDRVAKNIALAEAVYEAGARGIEIAVTPDQLKPGHPRRDELAAEVFGPGVTAADEAETALTEHNVNKFAYDTVVPGLPAEVRERVESVADEFRDLMEHLSFVPNSPTLMNAGDELQQLSACFVDSPEDDLTDIHKTAMEAAEVFQSGGGMGYAFWRLRPYGDPVGSTGGIASGPLTFMETYDQLCETIAQGGTRRGAQMAIMRVSHPDVVEFIHAKNKDVSLAHSLRLNDPDDYTYTTFNEALEEARELIDDDGRVPKHLRNAVEGHLSNFNISVGVTDEFMDALYADDEYTFISPRTGEPHVATEHTLEMYARYDLEEYVEVGEPLTMPARVLWERIVEGAWENGEPGVIYLDRVNQEHSFPVESTPTGDSSPYEILATNPCVTGETRIATADGRGSVPIADLADAGDDVPVYCRNAGTGEVEVQMGRRPRRTRRGVEVVEIATDGEVTLRCTPDHEVPTKNRGTVEAADLVPGDSLHIFTPQMREAAPANRTPVPANHKVVTVEPAGRADVYNLTVDRHHNYFAGIDVEDDAFLNVMNCGEQPLMEYEACNLGHINLSTVADLEAPDWRVWSAAHADEFETDEAAVAAFLEAAIDYDAFDHRIEWGTRFLEDVVTMSDFPVERIEETVHRNRKIGLGIMGLAQLYVQLGVRYGSDVGNEIARQLMVHINHGSKATSRDLAAERGSFANWADSKYADPVAHREWFEHQTGESADDWAEGFPIRNHNTTTIAPTGTTSMVGNTTGGCEPIYNVAYYKNVSDDVQGDEMLVEFDDYFLRVLEANDVDVEAVKAEALEQMQANAFEGVGGLGTVPDAIGDLFVVSGDIAAKEHAAVQCACQAGVDSAISKCIEEGTLVQTDQGLVPIEAFSDNDEPGTFSDIDGEFTIDGHRVLSHYYAGMKDSTRIRLDNGAELVGSTASHRVMTPNGWELLAELEEGDVVLGEFGESHSAGGRAIDWTDEFLTSSNDIPTPDQMSPRLAKWLGMIAADGGAYEQTGRVEITTADADVEREFASLCESLFLTPAKIDYDSRRSSVRRVYITSRNLVRYVHDLIGNGAYEKHAPDQVIRGNQEEKLAFIEGLTLDGHNSSNGFTVYSGMSKELAYQTAEILRSFGLPKVYQGRKRVAESEADSYSVVVSNELQELVTALESHKNTVPRSVRYKVPVDSSSLSLAEYETGTSAYSAVRSARNRGKPYLFNETAEKIGAASSGEAHLVTEVEDVGERNLYDIEVGSSHRYLVNGMVSHNTCNFPNSATVEDMDEVYRYIYDHGGKGVTVYRDGTRSKQVLTTRAQNAEFAEMDPDEAAEALTERIEAVFGGLEGFLEHEAVKEAVDESVEALVEEATYGKARKRPRPDVLYGVTQRIETGYGKLYVNINEDAEGRPFELFANIGNSGGFTASFTEALAKTVSTALRSGVDPREIADELQGIRSPKVAWDKGEQIQSIPDAVGTAMRRYLDGDIDRAYPQQRTLEETADEEAEADEAAADRSAHEPDGGAVPADPPAGDDASPAGPDATQSLIDAGESPECPTCGAMSLYFSEGCKTCESCGWSEC